MQHVRDKVGPLEDNAGNIITQICYSFEEISKWVHDGLPVNQFSFQKAFDKVPYQRLILKLK